MKQEVFIHIGYPKTGTTFLQEAIFKKLENVDYHHYLDIYTKIDKSKKLLISNEDFSGSFLLEDDTRNFYTIMHNLKHIFPDAKIIIGTRDKKELLRSMYKETIRQGYTKTYKKFLDEIKYSYVHNIIDIHQQGLLYTFEELKSNPHETIKKICDFIGEEVPYYQNKTYNKSITKNQARILRYLNKPFYHKVYNPRGLIPINPVKMILLNLKR